MKEQKTHRNTATLLGIALTASLGLSHGANAHTSTSLFSATEIPNGYMATAGEGRCGGDKKKDEKKEGEGKCGEGKCGGDSDDKKDGEGKCGEGKCGER